MIAPRSRRLVIGNCLGGISFLDTIGSSISYSPFGFSFRASRCASAISHMLEMIAPSCDMVSRVGLPPVIA